MVHNTFAPVAIRSANTRQALTRIIRITFDSTLCRIASDSTSRIWRSLLPKTTLPIETMHHICDRYWLEQYPRPSGCCNTVLYWGYWTEPFCVSRRTTWYWNVSCSLTQDRLRTKICTSPLHVDKWETSKGDTALDYKYDAENEK